MHFAKDFAQNIKNFAKENGTVQNLNVLMEPAAFSIVIYCGPGANNLLGLQY